MNVSALFVWWWLIERPQGHARLKLAEIFGKEDWARCPFVQFIIAEDDGVNDIRRKESGVPNVGGLDGPDRPPPSPPRTPVKHDLTADDSDRPIDSDQDPSDQISYDPSSGTL